MLSWSVVFLTLTCLCALFGFGLGQDHNIVRWLMLASLGFLSGFVLTFLNERRSRRR